MPSQRDGLIKCKRKSQRLSPDQLELLDFIWQESIKLEKYEWISSIDLLLELGGQDKGKQTLDKIGGIFVQEGNYGGLDKGYRLTPLGMFSCPSVKSFVPSLSKLLEYVRTAEKSALPITLPDSSIGEITGLNQEGMDDLFEVIIRTDFLNTTIWRNSEKKTWVIKKSREMPRLVEAETCWVYLDETILQYSREQPVHQEDRNKQADDSMLVKKSKLRVELENLIVFRRYAEEACSKKAKRISFLLFFIPAVLSASVIAAVVIINNVSTPLRWIAGGTSGLTFVLSIMFENGIGGLKAKLRKKMAAKYIEEVRAKGEKARQQKYHNADPIEEIGLKNILYDI